MAKLSLSTSDRKELQQRVGRSIEPTEIDKAIKVVENHIVTILLKEF